MKICFLAGTLEHGGAERQLLYMLQALCQSGISPRVLCLDRGEFWEDAIKNLGVSVTWVGQQSSRLHRLFRIMKELRAEPADVLQSQHFFANAYASTAARLLRVSGIGAMRNDGRSEILGSGRIGGWLNLRLPGTIAANSQSAIQYAISHGVPAARLFFLPNVVDTERFRPGKSASETPLTLLVVSRLVKQKRLDRFLSILARLRNDFHLSVRGLIAGPGCADEDLRPDLEAQAKDLGLLPEGVEFRGAVSDMAPLYREAAICVLTSDHEGTPNALLEAMASGLPVVATRVGGVPGIVQHRQSGLLFESDDLDGMVAGLLQLAENAPLRKQMGQRGRAYVEENHSLHRLPIRLHELYRLALRTKTACFDATFPNASPAH